MRKTVMETMSSSDYQFSSGVSSKSLSHTLHLYTSNVDKYIIQRAFLISNRNDEEMVYVTANDPEFLIQEFNIANVNLRIIKPEELRGLKKEKNCELRLIIDAGSIVDQKDAEIEKRESYLNDLSKRHRVNCLCTYDVTNLNFERIKRLTLYHNQLRLTTNDLTILSGDLFDGSRLSGESIEKMVKDNLESIILAIIFQNNTMCGTDIIGTIHLKFNVLLSPGTIYPLLHSLKQKGLLTIQKLGKEIVYTPIEDAKPKIKSIVNEHIQARKLLNHYLQHEIKI
jgi:DNA-binding PadR family transcriptional regulator